MANLRNTRKYSKKPNSNVPRIVGKTALLRLKLLNKFGHVALPLDKFKTIIKSKVKGDIIKTNKITTDYLLSIGEIYKGVYHNKIVIEYKGKMIDMKKDIILKIITKMVQDEYLSLKNYNKIDNDKITLEIVEKIKTFDLNFIYNA